MPNGRKPEPELLFGLFNGLIVAKLKFNLFIATLATNFIGCGLVMLISENRNLSGFSDPC